MNRCINPTGSTTSRWLAAANRLYSTSTSTPQSSQEAESGKILNLLSRWKPSTIIRPQTLEQAPSSPPTLAAGEQSHAPPIPVREPSLQVTETIQYKPEPAAPYGERAAATTTQNASLAVAYERPTLPVSPLMDPDVISAKEKHHARKLRPSKSPEPFQQILNKNPYAQALATPLRRCQLTHSALPSFFLQDFNLMAHPETGDPWYVPRSLTKKKAPILPASLQIDRDTELEPKDDTDSSSQPKQINEHLTPVLGHTVYTLAYQHALRAMQDPKGYKRKQSKQMRYSAKRGGITIAKDGPPARFIPDRYGQSKSASRFLSTARWRTDMHEFVLELMRRRTVEGLIRVTNLKRGYVVGCSGWEDALAKPQVGTFIWTGGIGELEEGVDIPPEFATLDVPIGPQEKGRTKKVPVHNLRRLLGKEKLAELRAKLPSGVFEREVVILRHKQSVLDVEMRLWKLQGYLAEYRDQYRDLEERPEQDLEVDEEEEDDEDRFEDDEDERR
ncbi:hypothetical protein N431DRAFT_434673 [Stipitochalara longipes BDJ]|nr:hypothetical protein N431DRAFT_434673 [Stipitochalara longipes BDJ]